MKIGRCQHIYSSIAQSVERMTVNHDVTGSSPVGGAIIARELIFSCCFYPGVAQFGSALEWGSRGRWFDSSHSDQNEIIRTLFSKWEMRSDFLFIWTKLHRETAAAHMVESGNHPSPRTTV